MVKWQRETGGTESLISIVVLDSVVPLRVVAATGGRHIPSLGASHGNCPGRSGSACRDVRLSALPLPSQPMARGLSGPRWRARRFRGWGHGRNPVRCWSLCALPGWLGRPQVGRLRWSRPVVAGSASRSHRAVHPICGGSWRHRGRAGLPCSCRPAALGSAGRVGVRVCLRPTYAGPGSAAPPRSDFSCRSEPFAPCHSERSSTPRWRSFSWTPACKSPSHSI